ncbi:MAG: FecR domain-containing protein [Saprospiraceae bacterium]|nr:FecR domain-containing protein [Lewinella sp.]
MKNKNFTEYSIDQLARDDDFRRWILHPEPEDHQFWQELVERQPKMLEKILTAKKLLQTSGELLPEGHLAPERKAQLHNQLMKRVQGERAMGRRRTLQYGIAAAISLILIAGLGYLFQISGHESRIVYRTDYGERKQFQLPDGSTVDLNAHSILQLGSEWENGDREVWLNGEAYFTVAKKPATGAKFTVHTPELDIEVLGTQFNVNTRKENTKVLLEEGKVRLLVKEDVNTQEEMFLSPGEMANFSQQTREINKQTIQQTKPVVSWKEGYLIYEKAALEKVIADIEDTYGIPVKLSDPALLKKKIKGALPTDNLEEFLKMAEILFGVQAKKQDDHIEIK